jgi:hypothetical protein
MPLIMRSTAALSWFIGSFGFIRFFSEGTWSARGWRCPTGASGSNCWSEFIDEGAAGFREPAVCAIAAAAMCGCGSGAILEAFPNPLGSTAELFIPPAFAGPRAIPLIGTFPIAPEPACPPPCPPRANEAAGGVKTMNNAIATFTEVLDMGSTTYDSLERRSRGAHVGSQTADTIKLNFRFRCASAQAGWSNL